MGFLKEEGKLKFKVLMEVQHDCTEDLVCVKRPVLDTDPEACFSYSWSDDRIQPGNSFQPGSKWKQMTDTK